MIPLPLLERSATLMSDDEPIARMFGEMVRMEKNKLVNAGKGLALDPRIFNARTFERVSQRAGLTGDLELSIFMAKFAEERKELDKERDLVNEAVALGRAISFNTASEIFRALSFQTDDQVLALRINGYRLAQVLGEPAFALVRDLNLIQ